MNLDPREAGFGIAFPSPPTRREEVKRELVRHVIEQMGRDPAFASKQDWFYALAYFLRGRLSAARIRTWRRNFTHDAKWTYYLSLELLPGRQLRTCLLSYGLYDVCREALADFGVDLEELRDIEVEPALGNGGLGRLAACIMESIASQGYAGMGYSIRYQYGMFRQKIEHGEQVEHPESWLRHINPWEFAPPNVCYPVQFYGQVTELDDWRGEIMCHWSGSDNVIANAFDIPVVGRDGETVTSVRLWSANATEDFNLDYFNSGNYIDAVKEKSESETLSKVLYPSDTTSMGRELRLKQEYFLVSASLQDILSRFERTYHVLDALGEKVSIQLNDTHPVLAIPELMRLLVDVYRMGWERAWDITVRVFSFTNHTLLSEALETWPVEQIQRLLPRHMQIIYEINQRFLRDVMHQHPGDMDILRRMSLIEENYPRSVRMAHLAIVGSHKINGVSRTHSALMRSTLFKDFDAYYPGRFINITNGISQRRWLNEANPGLTQLLTETISDVWLEDLERLSDVAAFADDKEFCAKFTAVKQHNKDRLAQMFKARLGIGVDPTSLFDLHIKRIHEYKRQLLNVLHVVTRYNRIRHNGVAGIQPRTVVFAGKAAPGYAMAKRIIQLINSVGDIVNNDPAVEGLLKVVFVPNYDVQTAEDLIPAADISQQISTAGTEASGTGNMKLALNGALTLATHDGANDEIAEAVGEDNVFMFGHTYDELQEIRRAGYDARAIYAANSELKEAIDMIAGGYFSPENRELFVPVTDSLIRHGDYYMLLADYEAYIACQDRTDVAFADKKLWTRKSIMNVAHMGRFSSDRVVRDYANRVWEVTPLPSNRSAASEKLLEDIGV
jgi:starch phosphorylase